MPVPMLKDLAKRYGLDLGTVEGYWNECKSAIKPDAKGSKAGYGVVVGCVKAKCRKAKKG